MIKVSHKEVINNVGFAKYLYNWHYCSITINFADLFTLRLNQQSLLSCYYCAKCIIFSASDSEDKTTLFVKIYSCRMLANWMRYQAKQIRTVSL